MIHGEPRTGLEIINGAKITAVSAAADELRENGFDFRCIKKTDPSIYQLHDVKGARELAERLLKEKGFSHGQEEAKPAEQHPVGAGEQRGDGADHGGHERGGGGPGPLARRPVVRGGAPGGKASDHQANVSVPLQSGPDLSLYSPRDIELLIEERACIMHYCHGVPWDVAQQRAWESVYVRTETRRTAGGGVEIRHTLVAHKEAPPAPSPEAQQQDMFGREEFQAAMRSMWRDY
jgi:hypothetical protein